jgi:hypothetical protein
MNRNNADTYKHQIDTDSELSLSDFMLRNYEQDPIWFTEPENTPEYGPPGMPTPFVPLDPRIAPRQQGISAELRTLISKEHMPDFVSPHLIDMLEVNFDSFNAILGESNNDSYTNWKSQAASHNLSPELRRIEELSVLGLARQKEMRTFLQQTDGFVSAEFARLFHPFKYRMRHLSGIRAETNEMILDAGGTLVDNSDGSAYYGLKIFPYVVETYVDLTSEQQHDIDMLQSSIFKKWEALHVYINENKDRLKPAPDGSIGDVMYNAVSEAIDADQARILKIQESTQRHTVEGLMASMKRRVGTIPKNEDKNIKVAERQLFALDLASYYKTLTPEQIQNFDESVHAARLSKKDQPASVATLKSTIEDLFIAQSELIIPVSTTTYGFEASVHDAVYSSSSPALGKLALGRSNRLRN